MSQDIELATGDSTDDYSSPGGDGDTATTGGTTAGGQHVPDPDWKDTIDWKKQPLLPISQGFIIDKMPESFQTCWGSNPSLYGAIFHFVWGIIIFSSAILTMNDNMMATWFDNTADDCYWTDSGFPFCVDANGVGMLVFHTILLPFGIIGILLGANGLLTYKLWDRGLRTALGYLLFVIFLGIALTIFFTWEVDVYISWDTDAIPTFPRCLIGLYLFVLLLSMAILFFMTSVKLCYTTNKLEADTLCNCCGDGPTDCCHKCDSCCFDKCPRWMPVQCSGLFLILWSIGWWMFCTLVPPLWHNSPGNWYPGGFVDWVETESNDAWTFNWLISNYSTTGTTARRRRLIWDEYTNELYIDDIIFEDGQEQQQRKLLQETEGEGEGEGETGDESGGETGTEDEGETSTEGENSGNGGGLNTGGGVQSITGAVIMKAFPDLFLYYGWILLVCFVAIFSKFSKRFRRFLTQRVFLHQNGFLSFFGMDVWSIYPTVGDILIFLSFMTMFTIWFYYWHAIHLYHGESKDWREEWSRTFGMNANLFAGMAFLPITRRSWWNKILGVSFEGVILYHIYIGYAFFLCSFMHVVLYLNFWDVDPNESLDVNLIFTNIPFDYIPNNPSIPYMWYIYIFFVIPTFAILTIPIIRRKYFEWFYYPHIIGSFITISAMLWHANSALYFILPSIGMYFIDRLMRFLDGTREARITTLEPITKDILLLGYQISDYNTVGKYKAHNNIIPGCYVYLKFDGLSTLQWHPFSLFNGKINDELENLIYIKREGEYTDQLWKMALANIHNNQIDMDLLPISVDGPYGHELEYSQYKHIVFIGGGIGITPINSVLSSLLYEYERQNGLITKTPDANASGMDVLKETQKGTGIRDCFGVYNQSIPYQGRNQVPRCSLIWTARDPKLFTICEEFFNNNNVGYGEQFDVKLFLTRDADAQFIEDFELSYGVGINHGRPKLFSAVQSVLECEPGEALLWACGPNELIKSCREVSYGLGMDFHTETFEL